MIGCITWIAVALPPFVFCTVRAFHDYNHLFCLFSDFKVEKCTEQTSIE